MSVPDVVDGESPTDPLDLDEVALPPRVCPDCGRSDRRHAFTFNPLNGQFRGWRSCELIADLERRLGPVPRGGQLPVPTPRPWWRFW